MSSRKLTQHGYLFLTFILLTISLLPVSGFNLTTKSVTISDDYVSDGIFSEYSEIRSSTMDPETSPVSTSHLSLDQTGNDFSTAIEIQMEPGGFYNNGSLTFTFDQNTAQRDVYFKYFINLTTSVRVTLTNPTGSTFDEQKYALFGSAFTSGSFESEIAFFDTFEADIPLLVDYPAEQEGYHYLILFVDDIEDYEFSAGEEVQLKIVIDHFAPGIVREDQISEDVQSQPFDIITRSEQYLQQTGYIDFQNAIVDLGSFNESDPGYAKAIGLSIYGMLKSAEYTSRAGSSDSIEIANNFLPILESAYSLFEDANQSMLEQSAGRFYHQPSEQFGIDDYVAYLEDNVYMILAMGELSYFGDQVVFELGPVLSFDPFQVQTRRDTVLNYTLTMFKNTTGDYRERVELVDYSEDGVPDFSIADVTSYTHDDENRMESYAVLAESLYWSNYFDFVNELTDILNYVLANMTTTTVSGTSISTEGIFLDSFNVTTSSASDTTSLLANALMLSHLASYTSEFGGTFIDVIAAEVNDTLQYISNLADNVLTVFSAVDMGSNLLVSQFNTVDNSKGKLLLTNIDNAAMVFALNRIASSWIYQETLNPSTNNIQAIISTWKKRSILGMNNIVNQFYESQDGYFFPQYDLTTKKFIVDDNDADTNLLAGNLYVKASLADLFPVQMTVLQQDDIEVGQIGQVSLALSQFQIGNTWAWWDPFKPFDADVKITIQEFDFQITTNVALSTGFDQGDVVVPFFYEVRKRGEYDIVIELSTEGVVLLTKTVTLTARGEARPEFSPQVFSIADTSFTTDIDFVDETGNALSSLQVQGSLGLPIEQSQAQFGNKYVQIGRTDTSGKLELTFNIANLAQDGLVNLTQLYNQDPIPNFIHLPVFLNITNADSFDLVTRNYIIEARVQLARASLRVSPSILEITQGTTESFTFTVTALDQAQEPISNALIEYSVPEIPEIFNTVFTDSDGEATITLRDSDLFALSRLAIVQNQDRVVEEGQALEIVNATIVISFNKQLYPQRIIARTLNVLPNSLTITANPVILSTKEANIFQQDVPPIEIEVATNDLFSRVINSFVRLEWAPHSDDANQYLDLSTLGTRIAPYTFELDVSNLPAGEYQILIFAEKDGITTTELIDFSQPSLATQDLDQIDVVSRPVIVERTIIIETSTLEDIVLSAVSLFGAIIALRLLNWGREGGLRLFGFYKECPQCRSLIRGNIPVCSACGRDTNFGKRQEKSELIQSEMQSDEPTSSFDRSSDSFGDQPLK